MCCCCCCCSPSLFFLVRHIVVWLPISNTKTPFGNPAYVIGYFILLLMCVYFVRHLVGGFCDFVSLDNFNLKWFANSINVDCRNEINTQFNVATSECRMLVLHWKWFLSIAISANEIGCWRVQ